jgi:hypothetical protein
MRAEVVIELIPGSKLTDSVTVDSRERDKNPEKYAAKQLYQAARRGHAPGVDFWLRTAGKIPMCNVLAEVINAQHFMGSTPLHVASYRVSFLLFHHKYLP